MVAPLADVCSVCPCAPAAAAVDICTGAAVLVVTEDTAKLIVAIVPSGMAVVFSPHNRHLVEPVLAVHTSDLLATETAVDAVMTGADKSAVG
jgi:hypothetical protein